MHLMLIPTDRVPYDGLIRLTRLIYWPSVWILGTVYLLGFNMRLADVEGESVGMNVVLGFQNAG